MVRFASEDHVDDPLDLEPQLIDLFRVLNTPQSLPFLVDLVRRDTHEVPDEVIESLAALGLAAVDPLLELLNEVSDPGDIPFLLSELLVQDRRILEVLIGRLAVDPFDAALCLEIYGDPAAIPALQAAIGQFPPGDRIHRQIQATLDILALNVSRPPEPPEPFDIWELYPENDLPALDKLSDEDRLAMLEKGSAELRAGVAESYGGSEPALTVRVRLIELAKRDPDLTVRGACWEALGEISDEPEIRRAMIGVLQDSNASLEEKSGAAVALALQADNPVVVKAIEALYDDPRSRAKALKAMARSLDRRFAGYPPKHLDDPDLEVRRQAIWGVAYLGLSSEAPRLEHFFDDNEFRSDALFAYALSIPGETSRGRVHALLNKIEDAAGGFRVDEEVLVKIALDQRLMLRGMKPVFFPDRSEEEEEEPAPVASSKVGRNDPCPCGSGKKYKKCCGA
ncbi:MAG TPA: SEC-C metal-binding domain-containing protein [Bryobacteraceae bacterium]|nr:SEC-C metal-binding domain-containing protein [Bryobacteraceae bacterium]